MGSTLRDVIDLIGWGPRRGHDVQIVLAGTATRCFLRPARHATHL